MNLFLLSVFGIFFSIIFSHRNVHRKLLVGNINNQNNLFQTYYFLLSFFSVFFICLASFQFIHTNPKSWSLWNGYTNDMPRYKHPFDLAINYKLKEFWKVGFEPLFSLIVWVGRRLTSHFSIFLFVCYSFILFTISRVIKIFKMPFSSIQWFCFFSIVYTFLLTSFCLFRMGMAVSFSLLFFLSLYKGDMKKALIFATYSSLIHFSAIFLFIVFFFYNLLNSRISFNLFIVLSILLFSLALLAVPFIRFFLSKFYSGYEAYSSSAVGINTYISNFFFLFAYLIGRKKFANKKEWRVLLSFLISGIFILPLQMVMGMFYRMFFYTYFPLYYIVSDIWRGYIPSEKNFLLPLIIRIFCFFYIVFYLYKYISYVWFGYGLDIYKFGFFY